MISDHCFNLCAAMEHGCKVPELYRRIATLRAHVAVALDKATDSDREALEDLVAACSEAFAGDLPEWEALAHRALTVMLYYEHDEHDDAERKSWPEFRGRSDTKPKYRVERRAGYGRTGGIHTSSGSSSDRVVALDLIEIERARRQRPAWPAR